MADDYMSTRYINHFWDNSKTFFETYKIDESRAFMIEMICKALLQKFEYYGDRGPVYNYNDDRNDDNVFTKHYREDIDNLKRGSSDSKFDQISHMLEDLQKKIDDSHNISALEQRLQSIETKIDERAGSVHANIDGQKTRLDGIEAKLNSQNNSGIDENLLHAIETIESRINDIEAKIGDLQNISAIEQRLNDIEANINRKIDERINSVHANIDTRFDDIEKKIDSKNTSAIEKGISSIRDTFDKFTSKENAESKRSEAEKFELKSTIEQRNRQLGEKDQQIRERDDRIRDLERQVESLNTDKQNLETISKNNIDRIISEKSDLERQNSDLERQKSDLERDKSNLEQQKSSLEQEIRNLESRIRDVEKDLESARRDLDAVKESARRDLDDAKESARRELRDLQSEKDSIQRKFEDEQRATAEFSQQLKMYKPILERLLECDTFQKLREKYDLNSTGTADLLKLVSLIGKSIDFAKEIHTTATEFKQTGYEPLNSDEIRVYQALNDCYKTLWNIDFDIFVLPGGKAVDEEFTKIQFNKNEVVNIKSPKDKLSKFTQAVCVPLLKASTGNTHTAAQVLAGNM